MDFAVPADHRIKLNENEKKFFGLARELKNLWNMKVTYTPIVIGALSTLTQKIGKRTRRLRNKRTSGDHPNYNVIDIGQYTKKSPGDLRRLAVTQTPVKIHQVTLM